MPSVLEITFFMCTFANDFANGCPMKLFLYRIYQWCIATPLVLLATVVIAVLIILGSPISHNLWGHWLGVAWGWTWCTLMGVRVKVKRSPLVKQKSSYVFVANHQGAYDIFSTYGFLGYQYKFMMRKGLSKIPFLGWAARAVGHIMVDTKSQGGIKATVAQAKEKLEGGVSLIVFPEGRRTDTGKMGPFKSGAFKLAVEFGLPLVPVTIDGSYRVMPRSTFNVTPGTIYITVHDPIEPGDDGHDVSHVMQECRRVIQSVLPPDERD